MDKIKVEALAKAEAAQCAFNFAWPIITMHFDNHPNEEARNLMHRIQDDLERLVRVLRK